MQLDHALTLLETYKYIILFPLAVIEGPIITIIAGFLVTLGVLDPFVVYAVVVAGDIVGDSLWYGAGRFGSAHILAVLERWFGITEARMAEVRRRMEKRRFVSMLLSKLIQGVGVAGIITAGILRLPYLLFLLACLIVTLGQVLFYLLIGIFFGSAYARISVYFDTAAEVGLIVAVGVVAFLIWRYHRKRK